MLAAMSGIPCVKLDNYKPVPRCKNVVEKGWVWVVERQKYSRDLIQMYF